MNNVTLSSNLTENHSSNFTGSTSDYAENLLPVAVRLPMVDKATSDLVQDIIYCGFLPALTVMGTMGNILSCIVLLIQGLKDSTNIFLFVLTISDTVYLLITGIRRIECIIGKFNSLMGHNLYMVTLPQMKPVAIIFSRFTGLLTMLISAERCIAVTKPMKVRQWFLAKRVWVMIGVLFIANLALLFPLFLTMELNWMTDRKTGAPMSYVTLTSFYKTNIGVLNFYLNIFLTVALRFVPVVLIFTFSLTIVIALKRSASFQKSSSSAKNDRVTKVTKMMLTICISYIIFQIPATVHQVFVFIYPEYNLRGFEKNIFYLISAFGQLVEIVNSSWNFVIYFALSEKFSVVLKQLLCSKCISKSSSGGKSSSGVKTKESILTHSKETA